MPKGIYTRPNGSKFHCTKCSAVFKSLSEMRKHQWHHKDTYAALSKTSTEISVREFIDAPVNGKADMTVSQLISALQRKHTFLADVIELIGGMQVQYEEAAHE